MSSDRDFYLSVAHTRSNVGYGLVLIVEHNGAEEVYRVNLINPMCRAI